MSTDPVHEVFREEAKELLQSMEDALFELENDMRAEAPVAAIFRAVHTIKGTAGIFGFDYIVKFTHEIEFILDAVRKGERSVNKALISALFPTCDYTLILVNAAIDGDPFNESIVLAGEALLKNLGATDSSLDVELGEGSEQNANLSKWDISVKFGVDSLRDGMDPLSFLRFLKTKGNIDNFSLDLQNLPEPEEFDPESCYLAYSMEYATEMSKDEIVDVFEFVMDDSEVSVEKQETLEEKFEELSQCIRQDDREVCRVLLFRKNVQLEALCEFLDIYKDNRESMGNNPLVLMIERQLFSESELKSVQKEIQQSKTKGSSESIRVDAKKLDELIDLVGELVTATANTHLIANQINDRSLSDSVEALLAYVEGVRESSLHLRMVPIEGTFNRFRRIVRDLGQELGKDISLHISGEDTELDKTVVEKLNDPLMHMVRNAIDHGIEEKASRVAVGKPEEGNLRLNAYHETGCIVIEIIDDGRGLQKDKIIKKAIEKNIISADHHLTEEEIYHLIFDAGFSTADSVSNISGRGVGMDVVKQNIEALRGYIEVLSEEGKGTTMRIRLPLTLAIIEGFLIKVGDHHFVLPLDTVEECIELDVNEVDKNTQVGYTNLRGEILPYVRLCSLFGEESRADERESLVVVKYGNTCGGFIVDELLGEFQTVIKPLGRLFSQLSWVTGSTILGSGEIALILDVAGLVRLTTKRAKASKNTYIQENNGI